MTFHELLAFYHSRLSLLYSREEADSIGLMAIEHVCDVNQAFVRLHRAQDLSMTQETTLIALLDELSTGKPVQYVLGEADFFGLRFKVRPGILVPRPETEELVDWVLKYLVAQEPSEGNAIKVLDIGTGSGCIPITLKKKVPALRVTGLDISTVALETASWNARLNEVDVDFMVADILSDELGNLGMLDIIISNPPYITHAEKANMHANVLEFEPHGALFVPDTDPLLFYVRIAHIALHKLNAGGCLFFEINAAYGAQTIDMLKAMGYTAELRKDMQGNDRMIRAWLGQS